MKSKRKRDLFFKYQIVTKIVISFLRKLPKSFSYSILKFNRRNNSLIAKAINYVCVKRLAKYCGANVAIFDNVYLLNIEELEIGDNVSIHPMTYIDSYGGITIGNDVSIAHGSSIISFEHKYDLENVNIKDQGLIKREIIIEDNVWIGSGVRILAGTKIKSGSIVAAGAVTSKDVECNSIVGGVPAKLIKKRI